LGVHFGSQSTVARSRLTRYTLLSKGLCNISTHPYESCPTEPPASLKDARDLNYDQMRCTAIVNST